MKVTHMVGTVQLLVGDVMWVLTEGEGLLSIQSVYIHINVHGRIGNS